MSSVARRVVLLTAPCLLAIAWVLLGAPSTQDLLPTVAQFWRRGTRAGAVFVGAGLEPLLSFRERPFNDQVTIVVESLGINGQAALATLAKWGRVSRRLLLVFMSLGPWAVVLTVFVIFLVASEVDMRLRRRPKGEPAAAEVSEIRRSKGVESKARRTSPAALPTRKAGHRLANHPLPAGQRGSRQGRRREHPSGRPGNRRRLGRAGCRASERRRLRWPDTTPVRRQGREPLLHILP